MWKKFYSDGWCPMTPNGYLFSSYAVDGLMNVSDELCFHGKIRRLRAVGGLPTEEMRIIRTMDKSHIFDEPREKTDPSILDERDEIAMEIESVFAQIGLAAFEGSLKSVGREKSGGPLIDIPAGFWGLDDYWPRLSKCALNIDHPYDDDAEDTHWIFFEMCSLYWLVDSERIACGFEPRWQRRFTKLVTPDEWPGPDKAEAALREAAGNLENFRAQQTEQTQSKPPPNVVSVKRENDQRQHGGDSISKTPNCAFVLPQAQKIIRTRVYGIFDDELATKVASELAKRGVSDESAIGQILKEENYLSEIRGKGSETQKIRRLKNTILEAYPNVFE
ncbi:hypothetical protein A8B75_11555 [Sphingomonadales bacterium EhC05]|nr:hypothetical protein A8B75_11555 [Sphingomonadales bacterium EhC05]